MITTQAMQKRSRHDVYNRYSLHFVSPRLLSFGIVERPFLRTSVDHASCMHRGFLNHYSIPSTWGNIVRFSSQKVVVVRTAPTVLAEFHSGEYNQFSFQTFPLFTPSSLCTLRDSRRSYSYTRVPNQTLNVACSRHLA